MAVLDRPWRSEPAVRERGDEEGRCDLDRRLVEVRRRRHAVGRDGLRSRARSLLHRDGQRVAVVAGAAQPWRRRQPVSVLDSRDSAGDRRIRLALPADAGGQLGLREHAAHRAGRSAHRRTPSQGADAGAEERLFLRDRSRDGRVHFREAVHDRDVGHRHRCEDRTPDRGAGGELRSRRLTSFTRVGRRAQLAFHGVSSRHRSRLRARAGDHGILRLGS